MTSYQSPQCLNAQEHHRLVKPCLWACLTGVPAADTAQGQLVGGRVLCLTDSYCPFLFPLNSRASLLKVNPCSPLSLHSLHSLPSPCSPRSLPSPHSSASPPSSASQGSHQAARCLRSPRRRRGPRQE